MKSRETQPVSIRLTLECIKALRSKARQISAERDQDVSLSDLIREAVEKIYPMDTKK